MIRPERSFDTSVGDNPETRTGFLVLYGLGAVAGNYAGGFLTDRIGGRRTLVIICIAQAVIMPFLSVIPWTPVVFAVLCYVAGTSVAIADVEMISGVRQLVGVPVHEYLGITRVAGGAELAVFCASIVGAGISFLWFNAYPASVFMGDVGSLALGGM